MYFDLFGVHMNTLAQVFDLIGFIIIGIAFFQKKYGYIITCIVAYFMFIAESIVLLAMDGTNAWANIICTTTGIVRNVLMMFFLKKWNKEVPFWMAVVLMVITWCANIPFFEDWPTYISCVALTVCTFTAVNKNYYVLKAGAFFNEAIQIIYYIYIGGYFGAVREAILSGIVLASVGVMIYNDIKAKKAKQSEPLTETNTTITKEN